MNKIFSLNKKMVDFMKNHSWLFQSVFAFTFGTSAIILELSFKGYDLLFPTWLHIIMFILLLWATIDFTLLNRKKLKQKKEELNEERSIFK